MKTEADFDKMFQGEPMRVSFQDLMTLYGGRVEVLDAIVRDEIPKKYQDEVWANINTDGVVVRALTAMIKLLEAK
jgi:hypothetical protein